MGEIGGCHWECLASLLKGGRFWDKVWMEWEGLMSRITFTEAERDLMCELSIRKGQVLRKLAHLVGSEIAGSQTHQIPLETLIGKGFDDRDSRMILKLVSTMRAIVEEAWLRCGSLFVKFRPEALSMFKKMALQVVEHAPRGNGVAYCEAALALKRAMGVRSEVWFTLDFDNESFNYGEDTAYMETAFESDSWFMGFEEDIGEFLLNKVTIRPVTEGQIEVGQSVSCKLPGCDSCSSQRLAVVQIEEFIDPEKWEKLLPDMAVRGRELVEKAKEKTQSMLEVRLDNGVILSRPEILKRMEEACKQKDVLCRTFGIEPEVSPSPEWPLGQEAKAYFREYSCNLQDFMNQQMENFGRPMTWAVEDFAGKLWLSIFEKMFGIKPDWVDIEDYGTAEVAEDFQEKFPDKAAEMELEYRQALGKAMIRIAWGLSTDDFKRVEGFVNGVIFHPAIGRKELKHIGWSFGVKNMEPQALRKCLDDAERDALSH